MPNLTDTIDSMRETLSCQDGGKIIPPEFVNGIAGRTACGCSGGMEFSRKLTLLIDKKGQNQSRLSRETGLHQTAISQMTKGQRRPYLDQGLRLARALSVSLDFLADDTLDEPPAPALSPEEAHLLDVVRALDGGVKEALRRIVNATTAPGPRYEVGIIAARDESASVNRPASYPRKVETRIEVKKET